ncbi:MAG TPA: histidine phosphatase family protein [Sphingomonadaceae bacterium]|nr:histidine phosphatase family protein [Sphingomonadaceae bacterium]
MKTLTLLRHAKSDWSDAVRRDFDRPLNDRGRRAAWTMGAHMAAEDLRFDKVVASPALRVRDTLDEVARGYGGMLDPLFEQSLYLASAAALLDYVRGTEDGVERLLLVGHNPGLEELALELAAGDADSPMRRQVEIKYPTATLAEIALVGESWADVSSGRILRFVRPRDLDPELGPDS